jgi:signal transduction histidine kinase
MCLLVLVFGVVIALLMQNIFLALLTKFDLYSKYILYVAVGGFSFGIGTGLFDLIAWNSWIYGWSRYVTQLMAVALLCAISFHKALFETRSKFRITHAWLTLASYLIGLRIVLVALGIKSGPFLIEVGVLILICAVLYLAYRSILAKKNFAYYVLVGWTLFAAAIAIGQICNYGILNLNIDSDTLMCIGFALEMASMSFAISSRLKPMQRELFEAEISARVEARRAEHARELLRVLSHDIMNPLGAVLGFLDLALINEEGIDREKLILFQHAQCAARSLEKLVNRIPTLLEVESMTSISNMEYVPPNTILSESLEYFKMKLAQKKIEIKVNQSGSPSDILVDKQLMVACVVNNILSNAIKFSFPNSTIWIDVDHDPNIKSTKIAIRDEGVGIRKEVLDKFFTYDRRVKTTPGTDKEKGTGYGMIIAHKTLSAMGGMLSVESIPMSDQAKVHGTTFKLVLSSTPCGGSLTALQG